MLGHLAAKGDESVESATLLVTVLDTEAPTMLGQFASKPVSRQPSKSRGASVCSKGEMARVFAWLRPNDLVWLFVANNWVMGNRLPAFDILYWNSDTTRLPAEFHADLLRMFMDNPLKTPGSITALGTAIDMSKVQVPAYVVAGITDHITPWQACYQSKNILRGKIDFVLSSSGHIQSIVNPPANPKAKYFLESNAARYRGRLAGRSQRTRGQLVGSLGRVVSPARRGRSSGAAFARQHADPAGDPAPGRYVHQMTKPHVEYIEVDGINLRVATQQGQARHTAAAVQRHRRQSRVVLPFMEAMPEKEIVIFDAPGVGRSEMSWRPRRFSGLASLANKLLDRLGYREVDVIGVSLEHWRNSSHASIRSAAG